MTKGRPGRKATDGAVGVERVTITLTPSDRELLRQMGGSAFVRQSIRRAARLEPDAKRYDWIRQHCTSLAVGRGGKTLQLNIKGDEQVNVTESPLDQMVDEAMEA